MDKQQLIAMLAENGEDRLLLAKVYDKLAAADRKNIPGATCFLSGREQMLVKQMVDRMGIPNTCFFGGTDNPDRQVICYVPDYYTPEDFFQSEDGPVTALRAEISDYDTLTHRDFLGGILGQGIKREVLGDIFVSEGHCDFLVLREMAPYLLQSLTSVGRAKIRLSPIALGEIEVPPQKIKSIRDTVASMRLDCVMASGFGMGRSKAQTLISSGRVEVNHGAVLKADRLVEQGDVISARGLGKFLVAEVNGQTKKGRIGLTLHRYL